MEYGTFFYLRCEYDYSSYKNTCKDCKSNGVEHHIISVPYGVTDRWSSWGAGIPTTINRCTGCDRENGPWVSSSIVGGGW